MTLAESVKTARIKAGYTQNQVSKLTNVSQSQISLIERGVSLHPHVTTLIEMADLFGCSLDELCGYKQKKPRLAKKTVTHSETFEQMMISAERYAFGRRTYMVSTTVNYLIGLLPRLSDWCLCILRNDMKSNAEMAERTGDTRIYGDSCDYNDWQRFTAELHKEIDRRLADGERHDFLC